MRLTLCGSTRFGKEFQEWNRKLTLAGHTVYSVAMMGRETTDVGKSEEQPVVTEEEKLLLDLVHLDKIMCSEGIVILNVNGYIGMSTRRELAWAAMFCRIPIFWLESTNIEHYAQSMPADFTFLNAEGLLTSGAGVFKPPSKGLH